MLIVAKFKKQGREKSVTASIVSYHGLLRLLIEAMVLDSFGINVCMTMYQEIHELGCTEKVYTIKNTVLEIETTFLSTIRKLDTNHAGKSSAEWRL